MRYTADSDDVYRVDKVLFEGLEVQEVIVADTTFGFIEFLVRGPGHYIKVKYHEAVTKTLHGKVHVTLVSDEQYHANVRRSRVRQNKSLALVRGDGVE